MIVPDVNLLLYAHLRGFAEHARARRWWEDLMNGEQEVALAAPTLFGFIRLATSPRVFDRPLPVAGALERVDEWLATGSFRPAGSAPSRDRVPAASGARDRRQPGDRCAAGSAGHRTPGGAALERR